MCTLVNLIQSFKYTSTSTISGLSEARLSLIIISAELKADSEETIETGTERILQAILKRTGKAFYWALHHLRTSNCSSSIDTQIKFKYFLISAYYDPCDDPNPERDDALGRGGLDPELLEICPKIGLFCKYFL